MPEPNLKSCWVTYSNSNFDPVKGNELYNRYLDEIEYAEELGFDGICVNEHHQNAYGLMPSPVVMAAAMALEGEGRWEPNMKDMPAVAAG